MSHYLFLQNKYSIVYIHGREGANYMYSQLTSYFSSLMGWAIFIPLQPHTILHCGPVTPVLCFAIFVLYLPLASWATWISGADFAWPNFQNKKRAM